MHFMKAITIFITRIFTRRMIDGLALIAPLFEAGVNVVLIGVQQTTGLNGLRQDRLDGDLLDVRQHPNHDVTRALQQTQDRWFLIRQGGAPTFTFQAAPPTLTTQFRDNFRVALCPATM
jgi:hypothetical protein